MGKNKNIYKEKVQTPVYPCIDLTIDNWDENLDSVLICDDVLYLSSRVLFQRAYMHHELIDCKGDIYKVIGKEDSTSLKRFLPFTAKGKVVLMATGKRMTVEELRSFMLHKIDGLAIKDEPSCIEWIRKIKEAKTVEELIAMKS